VRILHCVPSLGPGGAERQLTYLATEQVRAGHEVHVAVVAGGFFAERMKAVGATIHQLGARGRDPRLLWQMYRLAGTLRPDVIHTRLPSMDILGGAVAVVRRIPWIVSERSSSLAYARGAASAVRAMLARWATAIEANSAAGAAYWSGRKIGVPLIINPPGVPLEAIAATPAADPASLRIPDGLPLILFAGRFGSEKNVLLVLRALAQLFRETDAVAVLCGNGPQDEEARALATSLGIADRVRFPGAIEGVWSWMKVASVFVAPSIFEGRPNGVMEAAAAHCPLVVSDIPPHREFLDEGSALFVPADDPAAIAAALRQVIEAPADAAARAACAFAAVSPLTFAAMTARVDALYEDALRVR
jgi:glycosyltransferase involved in cell wall biosynthesis